MHQSEYGAGSRFPEFDEEVDGGIEDVDGGAAAVACDPVGHWHVTVASSAGGRGLSTIDVTITNQAGVYAAQHGDLRVSALGCHLRFAHGESWATCGEDGGLEYLLTLTISGDTAAGTVNFRGFGLSAITIGSGMSAVSATRER